MMRSCENRSVCKRCRGSRSGGNPMKRAHLLLPAIVVCVSVAGAAALPKISGTEDSAATDSTVESSLDAQNIDTAVGEIRKGRHTFRFDTFGDEAFWGGELRLHEAIEGAAHGGVGPGLSPEDALAAGLKVDVAALPPALRLALRRGEVDLTDPATTLTLLQLNAVVGVRG